MNETQPGIQKRGKLVGNLQENCFSTSSAIVAGDVILVERRRTAWSSRDGGYVQDVEEAVKFPRSWTHADKSDCAGDEFHQTFLTCALLNVPSPPPLSGNFS